MIYNEECEQKNMKRGHLPLYLHPTRVFERAGSTVTASTSAMAAQTQCIDLCKRRAKMRSTTSMNSKRSQDGQRMQ